MLHRFIYLKHALSLVLIFIGSKTFLADMLGLAKIPPALSLVLLAGGTIYSLIKTRSE